MMKNKIMAIGIAVLMTSPAVAQEELDTYHMRRGQEALSAGNYRDAVEAFGKELEANPDNGYASMKMGDVYSINDIHGSALDYYRAALKNIPEKDGKWRSKVYKSMSIEFREVGLEDEAMEMVNKAIKCISDKDKENAFNYALRSSLYKGSADMGKREADARKAIKIAGGDPECAEVTNMACITLYSIWEKTKNKSLLDIAYNAARTTLAKVDNKSDYDLTMLKLWNINLLKIKEGADKAVAEFLEVYGKTEFSNEELYYLDLYSKDPEMGPALLRQIDKLPNKAKGYVYFHNHNYRKAAELFTLVKKDDPSWEGYNYWMGECYQKTGAREQYIEKELSRLTDDLGEDSINVYFRVAQEYMRLRDFATAREYLKRYLDQNPANPWGIQLRGMISLHEGKVDEAIEDFKLGFLIDPDRMDMRMSMAVAYKAKGLTDKAKEQYELVAKSDGEAYLRALAAAHLGDQRALGEAQKEVDSEDPYFTASLASIRRDKQATLKEIQRIVDSGDWETDPKRIMQDSDFAWLREDGDFKALLAEYSQKIANYWK